MARRTKDDSHTRNTNEMTPEERRNLKPDHAKSVLPSKVADLIQNQKVPSGEHLEGTASPIERLTEKEKRKTRWSDVT